MFFACGCVSAFHPILLEGAPRASFSHKKRQKMSCLIISRGVAVNCILPKFRMSQRRVRIAFGYCDRLQYRGPVVQSAEVGLIHRHRLFLSPTTSGLVGGENEVVGGGIPLLFSDFRFWICTKKPLKWLFQCRSRLNESTKSSRGFSSLSRE